MKFRGLLIAVVVLAGLGGWLYWAQHHKAKPAPPATLVSPIVRVAKSDVTGLTLRNKGAQPIVLVPSGPVEWLITSPISFRADETDVDQMVAALADLRPLRTVDEKGASLARYGLTDPSLTVDIAEKNNKSAQLILGDKTPTGSGVYAMVPGDQRVYTLDLWVLNTFGKTANDLRNRHLIPVESLAVDSIEVLRKGQDFQIARTGTGWKIQKPGAYRANNYEVDDLIQQVVGTTWDESANTADSANAFAHGTPVATVKVTTASGTETLEVRQDHGEDYARSSAMSGTWKISNTVGTAVDRPVEAFRNNHFFDFNDEPLNVNYRSGAIKLELVRSNSDWFADGKKMDSASVESLVKALRGLVASKFVDSGYSRPDIDLTVVSASGTVIDRVRLQKTPDGAIGKRSDGPGLYFFNTATVNQLELAAAGVKPAVSNKK